MAASLTNGFKNSWALWLVFVIFCALYFYNISGWLMHDDEGTDFYEVWQLAEGSQPGVDYLAEQQPLYLQSGRFLMTHSKNDVLALRGFAAGQVLLGALILALVVNKIWGQASAVLSLGLLLGSGLLYEQARLFRPDPMMLAWELVGLAAVLTAVHQKKNWLWAVAGGCFGTAVLWKLFGVFPVVGLIIFFAYWLGKERQRWPQIVRTGLFFAIPFLLVAGGGSLLLYSQLGFYYREAFIYHLQANQTNGIGHQMLIVAGGYLLFLVSNAIFFFILPLRYLNRRQPKGNGLATAVLATQLLTPLIFLLITRPIHLRYYLFLLPTLAVLFAIEAAKMGRTVLQQAPKARPLTPLFILLIVAAGWLMTQPGIPDLLQRQETGTLELAAWVAEQTAPTDVVVSDYAGINYFAKRPSIYEASIIAGAQIDSGAITGALLAERIEEANAKLVLVHVAGGEPTPHQMVNLADYAQFREFLESHFRLVMIFDRAGQQIEVFERR